jgi:hypothetical protein
MRPSDDEYRAAAIHALMALDGNLHSAIYGERPSREASREIAETMREILANADKILDEDTEDLVAIVERAKRKVLEVFGTSGWDGQAAPPSDLPPLPSSSGRKR